VGPWSTGTNQLLVAGGIRRSDRGQIKKERKKEKNKDGREGWWVRVKVGITNSLPLLLQAAMGFLPHVTCLLTFYTHDAAQVTELGGGGGQHEGERRMKWKEGETDETYERTAGWECRLQS
jgi:hypothetical protein